MATDLSMGLLTLGKVFPLAGALGPGLAVGVGSPAKLNVDMQSPRVIKAYIFLKHFIFLPRVFHLGFESTEKAGLEFDKANLLFV